MEKYMDHAYFIFLAKYVQNVHNFEKIFSQTNYKKTNEFKKETLYDLSNEIDIDQEYEATNVNINEQVLTLMDKISDLSDQNEINSILCEIAQLSTCDFDECSIFFNTKFVFDLLKYFPESNKKMWFLICHNIFINEKFSRELFDFFIQSGFHLELKKSFSIVEENDFSMIEQFLYQFYTYNTEILHEFVVLIPFFINNIESKNTEIQISSIHSLIYLIHNCSNFSFAIESNLVPFIETTIKFANSDIFFELLSLINNIFTLLNTYQNSENDKNLNKSIMANFLTCEFISLIQSYIDRVNHHQMKYIIDFYNYLIIQDSTLFFSCHILDNLLVLYSDASVKLRKRIIDFLSYTFSMICSYYSNNLSNSLIKRILSYFMEICILLEPEKKHFILELIHNYFEYAPETVLEVSSEVVFNETLREIIDEGVPNVFESASSLYQLISPNLDS
ncbi:hypothetical protein TRFO_26322 [Tritrichomonas foetus]|uniref:Uncharacterized protein n=1 Tax=Tritrichomonas foetus TaxID=1144522 RepID=A0A1J4K7Z1_9EUKA|nr:hypothetical protein TRFO_26322 [Tritrichomonas foetus]|eukprot:OHT05820.1 hypothetical protein TRFO_26322 [Tritrichomonas foetus]